MKAEEASIVTELTRALLEALVCGLEPDEEHLSRAKELGINIDYLRELADEEK